MKGVRRPEGCFPDKQKCPLLLFRRLLYTPAAQLSHGGRLHPLHDASGGWGPIELLHPYNRDVLYPHEQEKPHPHEHAHLFAAHSFHDNNYV